MFDRQKVEKIKYIYFFMGALIAGLTQGLALASFGAFADSQNYYQLFEDVRSSGVFETIISQASQTNKLEPFIILLFAGENFLSMGSLAEYWFLVLNITLLNILVASVMFACIDRSDGRNGGYIFFVGFIVVTGYLVFSKELYFWRSVIAASFFIAFIRSKFLGQFFWGLLGMLTHSTFLIYFLLYFLIKRVSNYKYGHIFCILLVSFSVVLVNNFQEAAGFFVSSGDLSVFLNVGGGHAIKVWISILYSMCVMLLIYKEFMISASLRPLFIFCFSLIVASIFSFNSYHLMNRMFLPASLYVGFFPFLINNNTFRFKLARVMIVISIIPTLRLLVMLSTGSFTPE